MGRIWKREFELADLPANETYQFSCPGRHKESFVFAGSIVPILNKLLASASISVDVFQSKPFSVVRVETNSANTEKEASQEELSDSEDEPKVPNLSEMVVVDPVVGGKEDIGKGVARQSDKVGKCVFRGEITKYKDDNMHEDCDPSGTFFTKFSDGNKLKMDASQVSKALKLFAKEANRLVASGMPLADARNALEESTAAGLNGKSNIRKPVLGDGEDEDPENHELIFEETNVDEVPDGIVGLMFDNKHVTAYDAANNAVVVPRHEQVLMHLSKKLVTEGVASARQLYNLEKAEHRAGNNASSGSVSGEDED